MKDSILSKTTLVAVITYNPEIDLLQKNLKALLGKFESVLIVDNNSENIDQIEKLIKANGLKVDLEKLSDNLGIAYAQNVGLKKAAQEKMKWLLTMDQDSVIPENLTVEYQKVIDKYNNIGLIGWNQRPSDQGKDIVRQDWFILSSGCLMSVEALQKCKGFDEKLFIDHVDTEANMKIRTLGYKTLTTSTVKLSHQLGTKTTNKTIRGNPYITHSPVRIYYNVRNSIVLFKRYFWKLPAWTMIAIINNIRESIYLLLYQPNKLKNFALLMRAWFDGIFNRLGKFTQ